LAGREDILQAIIFRGLLLKKGEPSIHPACRQTGRPYYLLLTNYYLLPNTSTNLYTQSDAHPKDNI